jgi:iron(III) transport system substrate-binding protein
MGNHDLELGASFVKSLVCGPLLPLAFCLLPLVAACGGSAASSGSAAGSAPAPSASGKPSAIADLAAYRGADRQQMLEAGAKREGALTWYTSLAGDVIQALTDGFKAKYGIPVDVFRGDEGQLITRATQEAQAGKQVFDVVESPVSTGAILGEARLLAPFYSPGLAGLPEQFKRNPKGALVDGAAIRMTLVGFGYNTNLIPESAVPKTIEDLMNPALTGKLSLAGSTTGNRWAGSVLHKMGGDAGKKWLQQFAAQQKPKVQQLSGKAVFDLVAKGEVPASPTIFRDHVEQGAEQGAPVKWVGLEPVTANVGQVNLAAKAPHPNAALLFIDYTLGSEGQEILQKYHYSVPSEKLPVQVWVPEEGRTPTQDEQDMNTWADVFKATFR